MRLYKSFFLFTFGENLMAGHSKWHNIKHRKAAQDAQKSKYYATVGKIIQMAARDGADPFMNPKLALALQKAKQYNLPKEVVQRAIDKWSGAAGGEDLQEIFYEGYGPGGVALYIKAITSNSTRTGQSVRALLTKYGGSLWTPGSVAWQFSEKWEIYVSGNVKKTIEKGREVEAQSALDSEVFELDVLETDADEVSIEDGEDGKKMGRVLTTKECFITVKQHLEERGYKIDEADIQYIAENTVELDENTSQKLETLLEMLESDDDVDTVWHNAA